MSNFKILGAQKQGTPGIEPGTSRSAVECSTPELYPRRTFIKKVHIKTIHFYKSILGKVSVDPESVDLQSHKCWQTIQMKILFEELNDDIS